MGKIKAGYILIYRDGIIIDSFKAGPNSVTYPGLGTSVHGFSTRKKMDFYSKTLDLKKKKNK